MDSLPSEIVGHILTELEVNDVTNTLLSNKLLNTYNDKREFLAEYLDEKFPSVDYQVIQDVVVLILEGNISFRKIYTFLSVITGQELKWYDYFLDIAKSAARLGLESILKIFTEERYVNNTIYNQVSKLMNEFATNVQNRDFFLKVGNDIFDILKELSETTDKVEVEKIFQILKQKYGDEEFIDAITQYYTGFTIGKYADHIVSLFDTFLNEFPDSELGDSMSERSHLILNDIRNNAEKFVAAFLKVGIEAHPELFKKYQSIKLNPYPHIISDVFIGNAYGILQGIEEEGYVEDKFIEYVTSLSNSYYGNDVILKLIKTAIRNNYAAQLKILLQYATLTKKAAKKFLALVDAKRSGGREMKNLLLQAMEY